MIKLSEEAQNWHDRILTEYSIDDEAGKLLVQTALESFDRMRQAQRVIEKEGLTFKDRFGQIRNNPATTIERDAKASMLMALKQLNLDFDTIK